MTLRKASNYTTSFSTANVFHLHKFHRRDYKIPKAQGIDIDLYLAWMHIRVLKRTTRGSLLFTEIEKIFQQNSATQKYIWNNVFFSLWNKDNIMEKPPKWNYVKQVSVKYIYLYTWLYVVKAIPDFGNPRPERKHPHVSHHAAEVL